MKRQRGRGRKPSGNNSNRSFESNGPDIKVRGSAPTIYEKYQQLARDAASSGDRIMAESYLQHAEHYFRIMRVQQAAQRERDEQFAQQRENNENRDRDRGNPDHSNGGSNHAESGGSDPMSVVDPEARQKADTSEGGNEESGGRRPRRPRRPRSAEPSSDASDALDAAGDKDGAEAADTATSV